MSTGKQVVLAGATGLVGERCLHHLLEHPAYSRVTVWSRRPLSRTHPKLAVELVDFDALPSLPRDCVEVFCCLGTTIRIAGTQEAFRRVDHDFPVALAERARTAGAQQFLLVSSLGADARSKNFYLRVKGETERDVAALGLPRHLFFRPSLLLGNRREHRRGERLAIVASRFLSPLLIGPIRKYRPVEAADLAAAMVRSANLDLPSGAIESDRIAQLAG